MLAASFWLSLVEALGKNNVVNTLFFSPVVGDGKILFLGV
jgi:hypothetical protein